MKGRYDVLCSVWREIGIEDESCSRYILQYGLYFLGKLPFISSGFRISSYIACAYICMCLCVILPVLRRKLYISKTQFLCSLFLFGYEKIQLSFSANFEYTQYLVYWCASRRDRRCLYREYIAEGTKRC